MKQPKRVRTGSAIGVQPRPVGRGLVSLLVILVGGVLSVTMFVTVRERLERQALDKAAGIAERYLGTVQEGLAGTVEALRSIGSFYAASREVERDEFKEFTAPILIRQPHIFALSWLARVPRAERATFEELTAKDGFDKFQIVERFEGDTLVNASQRPEYVPVTFVEPAGPAQSVIGLDMMTLPDRWSAIQRARDIGEPASTDLLQSVSVAGDYSLTIYLPIYRNGLPHNTLEERRANLQGFAAATLRIPRLVSAAFAKGGAPETAIVIEPPWSDLSERRLYQYPADTWTASPVESRGPGYEHITRDASGRLVVTDTWNIAGRTWSLHYIFARAAGSHAIDWAAWAVLFGGLLFTGLLAAYLFTILGRHEEVERLIAVRTQEWVEANRQLEQQMAQRVRLERERELQHSEMERTYQELAAKQEELQGLLRELQESKAALEAHNQEMARREQVMQSLLEDLNTAKERIAQQAGTLHDANERLKELAVLKDEFVAKVSHELRTPLTSVKEGLSLMLDGALGATTADQQDFIKTMDGDVDRLTELISNMLDISKIEAGRMRLFRSRMELPKLIESVRRSYQALLGKREVLVQAPAGLPPVFGDPHRLTQVFTNLLSNAIRFTHEDDGRITFRLTQNNGMIAIAVQDNGPGIAPDDMHRLFKKFSQIGQPLSGGHRGTGLGLVVCKELAELHGGRIEVASTLGKGTTFTVSIPAYTERFALDESFREQLQLASQLEGQAGGVTLVAVDAAALVKGAKSAEAHAEALEKVGADVRQHLHRGDVVLTLGPSWIVTLSATDLKNAKAIVKRLRERLEERAHLRFGAAVAPLHGDSAPALFSHATTHLDQDVEELG